MMIFIYDVFRVPSDLCPKTEDNVSSRLSLCHLQFLQWSVRRSLATKIRLNSATSLFELHTSLSLFDILSTKIWNHSVHNWVCCDHTIQFHFATSLSTWWNISFVTFLLPPLLAPSLSLPHRCGFQMWRVSSGPWRDSWWVFVIYKKTYWLK